MSKIITALLIAACCGQVLAATVDAQTPVNATPASETKGWLLDFSDEFNGNSLDLTKWSINVSTRSRNPRPAQGINDWWWKHDNVSLDGTGNLVLDVVKHDSNTMYNGSISSKGLYEPTYGYLEARINIADTSKTTHTAFWTQGHYMGNIDGTGNDGAEVDIFESAWVTDSTKAVVHIDGYGSNHRASTVGYKTPGIHSGFHTFGMEWNEHVMNIYYDGVFKVQYEGIWVPKVAEWLWLSNGASFGSIGSFTEEANGYLTSSKVDYVRVWQAIEVDELTLIGGNKLNGNFNAETGANVNFKTTPGWTNKGGSSTDNATQSANDYDGSQNLIVTSSQVAALNTGYSIVEGDSFDISYVWKDGANWQDNSARVQVSLFVTDDNTITGTSTTLVDHFSPLSTIDSSYQPVSSNSIYTAIAADVDKALFVAITGSGNGFASLDNFQLIKHKNNTAPTANNAPTFLTNNISKTGARVGEAFADSIQGSAVDLDEDALTYQILSGPNWLTMAVDGAISGTPEQSGDISWSVEVSDGENTTATTVIISVAPEATNNDNDTGESDDKTPTESASSGGTTGNWVLLILLLGFFRPSKISDSFEDQ